MLKLVETEQIDGILYQSKNWELEPLKRKKIKTSKLKLLLESIQIQLVREIKQLIETLVDILCIIDHLILTVITLFMCKYSSI